MNVRFIDTSIIMNLLEIPYMCDKKDEVKEEFRNAIENGERLVLPISVIIESGNHIAHIADGNMRKEKAESLVDFLKKQRKMTLPGNYSELDWIKKTCYILQKISRKTRLRCVWV